MWGWRSEERRVLRQRLHLQDGGPLRHGVRLRPGHHLGRGCCHSNCYWPVLEVFDCQDVGGAISVAILPHLYLNGKQNI